MVSVGPYTPWIVSSGMNFSLWIPVYTRVKLIFLNLCEYYAHFIYYNFEYWIVIVFKMLLQNRERPNRRTKTRSIVSDCSDGLHCQRHSPQWRCGVQYKGYGFWCHTSRKIARYVFGKHFVLFVRHFVIRRFVCGTALGFFEIIWYNIKYVHVILSLIDDS